MFKAISILTLLISYLSVYGQSIEWGEEIKNQNGYSTIEVVDDLGSFFYINETLDKSIGEKTKQLVEYDLEKPFERKNIISMPKIDGISTLYLTTISFNNILYIASTNVERNNKKLYLSEFKHGKVKDTQFLIEVEITPIAKKNLLKIFSFSISPNSTKLLVKAETKKNAKSFRSNKYCAVFDEHFQLIMEENIHIPLKDLNTVSIGVTNKSNLIVNARQYQKKDNYLNYIYEYQYKNKELKEIPFSFEDEYVRDVYSDISDFDVNSYGFTINDEEITITGLYKEKKGKNEFVKGIYVVKIDLISKEVTHENYPIPEKIIEGIIGESKFANGKGLASHKLVNIIKRENGGIYFVTQSNEHIQNSKYFSFNEILVFCLDKNLELEWVNLIPRKTKTSWGTFVLNYNEKLDLINFVFFDRKENLTNSPTKYETNYSYPLVSKKDRVLTQVSIDKNGDIRKKIIEDSSDLNFGYFSVRVSDNQIIVKSVPEKGLILFVNSHHYGKITFDNK